MRKILIASFLLGFMFHTSLLAEWYNFVKHVGIKKTIKIKNKKLQYQVIECLNNSKRGIYWFDIKKDKIFITDMGSNIKTNIINNRSSTKAEYENLYKEYCYR